MASQTVMPYNTRRKSLSLPSLGIHVPVTHAARDAARAAANRASPNGGGGSSGSNHGSSKTGSHNHPTQSQSHGHRRPSPNSQLSQSSSSSSSASASPSASTPTVTFADSPRLEHPNKKMKRSHGDDSPVLPRKLHQQHPPAQRKLSNGTAKPLDHTPPLSPKTESVDLPDADDVMPIIKPIDLESINDEIVTAVIVQLQNTRNRPHLVKELTAILMLQLKIVQQSANPCAIISSRLSTFLKRPCWTESSPCPLAKELETVHPRRTYFYLTNCPHQPLPPNGLVSTPMAPPPLLQRAIITPSLSSGASGSSEDADEEEECDRRRELSPSPEIDLSAPDFDDFDAEIDDILPLPITPIGSFSGRPMLHHSHHSHHRGGHHHHHSRYRSGGGGGRGASPPLEKDEREFTQTANVLQQKRKASGSNLLAATTVDVSGGNTTAAAVGYNSRDENLFGGQTNRAFTVTSPNMRPTLDLGFKKDPSEAESWAKLDSMMEWNRSPENIELEELDCLLVDF